MRVGPTEILLLIVLALILFGGGKVAGLGKALGKSIREFRSELKSDDTKASVSDVPEKKEP